MRTRFFGWLEIGVDLGEVSIYIKGKMRTHFFFGGWDRLFLEVSSISFKGEKCDPSGVFGDPLVGRLDAQAPRLLFGVARMHPSQPSLGGLGANSTARHSKRKARVGVAEMIAI